MSITNRTQQTNAAQAPGAEATAAAELEFWTDLGRFAAQHDTEDLSLAAKLVHDAASRAADPPNDESRLLDVRAFQNAADYTTRAPIRRLVVNLATDISAARNDADTRFDRLEAKLAHLAEELDQINEQQLPSLSRALDAIA